MIFVGISRYYSARSSLSLTAITHPARSSRRSCSQKRRTAKPWACRASVVFRSRLRFLLNFSFQNSEFLLGVWPHLGQPCQKHPSTKTTSRTLGNKKSGFPESPFGCICQPLTPSRTSANRKRFSVVLFPFPRTADIARERTVSTPSNWPFGSFWRRAFSISRDELL